MKKVKSITCWTDYPFLQLGDKSGQKAPIRRVKLIEYDGNKYCKVQVVGEEVYESIKAGYLYSQPGRYGQVKQVNMRKIERMGDGKRARQADRQKAKWDQEQERT